jgi:hypothetical protein
MMIGIWRSRISETRIVISTETMIEREIGMMMVIGNAIVRKTEMIENAKVIGIGTATVIVETVETVETVIVGVEREIVVAVIGIAIMTVIEKEIGRETILDGLVHEKEREREIADLQQVDGCTIQVGMGSILLTVR